MSHIVIDGYNYYYEQIFRGNKQKPETIVFIHGAGGNYKLWYYQSMVLSQDFCIMVPDLPGHGKSDGKPSRTIDGYSSFINNLLEYTVKEPVFLAGHSMGGAIAMDFALKYPQKIKGLVLIGTGSRLKVAPQILDTFRSGQHFFGLIKWFYRNPPQKLLDYAREDMLSTDPRIWFADFSACNNCDITDRLADIKLPVLVIGAESDMLTPLKFSKLLVDNLPQAVLEVINEAGHMMMLEKPGIINEAISKFIKGV